MARQVRDAKLGSRTARAELKPSGKPYWRALDPGLHLGYRKGKTGGKWVMRRYLGGKYAVETLGTADDKADGDGDGSTVLSFAEAQTLARQRFTEGKRAAAGLPTQSGPYTVAACLAEYLTWLEQNRKSGRVVRWTAEASILPELGAKLCAKLTTDDIRRWLEKCAREPARLRTKPGQKQRYREAAPEDREEETRRRRATANRKLVILKAALNRAWREKRIASDDAWRAVKPFREADVARLRYLTVEEGRRLINAAAPDFRLLVQAALATGCRFGELAALTVADFNPDSGTLHIRTSKSGKGRHVVLTEEGVEFFKSRCAGRTGADRMLPKADGGRWLKSHQSRPMADACKGARIDPPANFHCLRHTYASLTIMAGAPLMVVARNLGHADTRMVEKHYGHLAPSYVADAIRSAAPRFGISAEGNVTALERV
jgi:integrase